MIRLQCMAASVLLWTGLVMGQALRQAADVAPSLSAAATEPVEPVRLMTAPKKDLAAENLRTHGIGLHTEELLSFLEKGWPANIAKNNFPAKPVEKTQLIVDAMTKLVELHEQKAVPVIEKVASLKMPDGVNAVVMEDLERTTPEGRESFKNKAYHILQYNAVTALAALNSKKSLPLCKAIFNGEKNTGARIQYALCMAQLGDSSGLDFLVQVIQMENRRESAAAARAFYLITGQDFGYTENTALRMRKTLAKKYRDWLQQTGRNFQPDPEKIVQRRANPANIDKFEPRSTRDLLKLAGMYFDFNDEMKSAQAREKIALAGTSLNPELERIATDVNEDLDIRMEAINWFFHANRSGSQSLLKKLKRDENPEIADKADTLLQQIQEDENGPAALRQ